jgi:hypothetical protein
MNSKYIAAGLISFLLVIGWNIFLAKRDQQLLKSYDSACASLSQPHPNCRYAK